VSTYKVRVCPYCHTENPATASDCVNCKADILAEPLETRDSDSSVSASADQDTAQAPASQQSGPNIVLEPLQDPDTKFKIYEGQSVGRTKEADVVLKNVPNADYISRRMAVFTRRGEQWFVQHVGSTNYITVDGDRYETDDSIAIHDGSVLGLALSQFMVRIPESAEHTNG